MGVKPEILQQILSDADSAEAVNGMKNTYTPEEYNKLMAKNRAMGLINDHAADGLYSATVREGDVEFDANGNLRKIKRNAPMMLDLNRYTANRYFIDKVGVPGKGEKKVLEPGTYIVVVFGEAIVNAINANTELPRTVKAFRFYRTKEKAIEYEAVLDEAGQPTFDEATNTPIVKEVEVERIVWRYIRSEFIKNEVVYTMTGHLKADDALKLIQQVEELSVNSADDRFEGESLDDIA